MIDAPTQALRHGSPTTLRDGLLTMLRDGELKWMQDRRDLLVAMAPYHDCARRLELDPATFFASVATEAPMPLADIVRMFGERSDVTPAAFGFRLVTTPDGAAYEWTG